MSETISTKNTAEILRAAAGHVRQGWVRGVTESRCGRVCAIGGIAREVGTLDWETAFERAPEAISALANMLPVPAFYHARNKNDVFFWTITGWNDADGQTAENVAQGLEYAALLWEQERAQQATEPSTNGEVQEATPSLSSR